MYCPLCGTQNDDTARFCVKCGQPIVAPAAENTKRPAVRLAPPRPAMPARRTSLQGGPDAVGWLGPARKGVSRACSKRST